VKDKEGGGGVQRKRWPKKKTERERERKKERG